jgi:ribosomal protein S18 acetylase RimI-like enzyme
MSVSIRIATSFDDFTLMGIVAANAYADNAAYAFLWHHLATDQERVAANAWLLSRRMWVAHQTGGVVFCAVSPQNQICGTIAFSSQALQPGFLIKLQAGYFLLPLWFGMQTLTNLDAMIAALVGHEKEAQVPHDRPVVMLQMVTVDPAFQKMGIGSLLLQRALDEIKQRHGRVTVVLDTQKDFAARFYAAHGFKIASERDLTPLPGHTFKNWVMFKQLD